MEPFFPVRRLNPPNLGGRPRGPAKTSIAFWLQMRLTFLRFSNRILAQRTGLSATNIGKWIVGDRTPNVDSIRRLAKALGTTPGYFLQPIPEGVTLPIVVTEELASGGARKFERGEEPQRPKRGRAEREPIEPSEPRAPVDNSPRASEVYGELTGDALLRAAIGEPIEGGIFEEI